MVAKGSGDDVPWTSCAGNFEKQTKSDCLDGRYSESAASCWKELTHLSIKFPAKKTWCVPSSLVNVTNSSRNKAKLLRKDLKGLKIMGLAELSNSAGVLGVSLRKIEGKDVDWLLTQEDGKYLVLKDVHCISIDCSKGHLFDSGLPHVMELSKAALINSGIYGQVEIRQVR